MFIFGLLPSVTCSSNTLDWPHCSREKQLDPFFNSKELFGKLPTSKLAPAITLERQKHNIRGKATGSILKVVRLIDCRPWERTQTCIVVYFQFAMMQDFLLFSTTHDVLTEAVRSSVSLLWWLVLLPSKSTL
jgi:hypothetical protein